MLISSYRTLVRCRVTVQVGSDKEGRSGQQPARLLFTRCCKVLQHISGLLPQTRYHRQDPLDKLTPRLALCSESLPPPHYGSPQSPLGVVIGRLYPFDSHERPERGPLVCPVSPPVPSCNAVLPLCVAKSGPAQFLPPWKPSPKLRDLSPLFAHSIVIYVAV
jgi:hypothetical protein